jgi:hypothetical protein
VAEEGAVNFREERGRRLELASILVDRCAIQEREVNVAHTSSMGALAAFSEGRSSDIRDAGASRGDVLRGRAGYSASMGLRAALGGPHALVVASVLVTSGCGNGARTASRSAWTSCTFSNPSGYGLDVRNFEVRGGETCLHASKLINGVEQGFEGGCGASCHVLRFTCHEHPGGLTHYPTGQGTGSYYAYSDAQCARDAKHARWRVYVSRD